jgi:E1-E2 ATPase
MMKVFICFFIGPEWFLSLTRYRIPPVNLNSVKRESEERLIAAAEVPGDVLLLTEGVAISADARVLVAERLRIEMSSLTGESKPVPRTSEDAQLELPVATNAFANLVFAGTSVVVVKLLRRCRLQRRENRPSVIVPGPAPRYPDRHQQKVRVVAFAMRCDESSQDAFPFIFTGRLAANSDWD